MGIPDWTPDDLREHLAADEAVLVDWWADWCTNCAAQLQVMERIAADLPDRLAIGKINVGSNPGLADEFGIQSLPTLSVFVGGREVDSLHGFRRAPEIREAVHRVLSGRARPARGSDDAQR
jgi:thioredoxin-like negative regulator of GroEL